MNLNSEKAKALFKERVEPRLSVNANGCWETTYAIKDNGYVYLHVRPYTVYLHRLSYMAFKGEIPENLQILHSCDNRKCCNPAHLSVGTSADNIHDMDKKGRRVVWNPEGEKNPASKLTRLQVEEIRASNEMQKCLAVKYNVSKQLISEIKRNNVWI